MVIHCETTNLDLNEKTNLESAIIQTTRDITKLRATVNIVPFNTLPNDGKLIEDARSYA